MSPAVSPALSRAVLSIGSNLGDRVAHLRGAVAALGHAVRAVSPVYETPPWGDTDQPEYLNAVVLVAETSVVPRYWLEVAGRIEAAAGRRRDPGRRFGPRTLDVDVIAVWADDGSPVLLDSPDLTLPHPRAHLRAFVLRPWLDVAPDAVLPGAGRLADLLRAEPLATDARALHPRYDVSLGIIERAPDQPDQAAPDRTAPDQTAPDEARHSDPRQPPIAPSAGS